MDSCIRNRTFFFVSLRPKWCILLNSLRWGRREAGGFLRSYRVPSQKARLLAKPALWGLIALLISASSWPQTATFQNSGSATRGSGSPQSPANPPSSQSTPQNPSHPNPQQQNPPPSAQLPIKNPEVRPAPLPGTAPPSLTIPRLPGAPALEDFLSMQPQGGAAPQMAKVTGFSQRNPHDGESV